jgi:pyruvate dehydrogenase E2 component (dihydrolipoamide acetyltransferase)
MAHEITVPRLGWSMEEGTFLRWLKQDGDRVQIGEPLFELEGEKAAQEIEALDSGILRIPADSPQPGAVIRVGTILGYLVAENESTPTPAPISSSPAIAAAQSASRRAAAKEVRTAEGDRGSRIVATPRARRLAKELNIDWRAVDGTGIGGRIRERDIRAAESLRPVGSPHSTTATSRRPAIAARLRKSQELTVPVTLISQADATNLMRLREKLKAAGQSPVPSYGDIIAKLVAGALKQHPYMAARFERDRPVPARELNVGIAVDTADGLLVPVVRNVDELSLGQVAARSRDLIDRARAGTLAASDMQDAVFTITNLGGFGIDFFTPVINFPEIAILGLGAIRRMPVVYQGEIQAREIISLSLTFDHAAVDGAPAAKFLQAVCRAIENPLV